MKNTIRTLAVASLFASGLALAAATPVEATVNTVDAKAGTVTLQMADGTTGTYKAEGGAAKHLAKVTTGEKVMVTFRDEASGTHAAIVELHAEKAKAATKK